MKITIDTTEPLSASDADILRVLVGDAQVDHAAPTPLAAHKSEQDAAVERAQDPTFAPGAVSSPTTREAATQAGGTPPEGWEQQPAPAAPEAPKKRTRRTKAQIAEDKAREEAEAAKAGAAPAAEPAEGQAVIQGQPVATVAQQPIQVPPGHAFQGFDPAGQPIFQPAPQQGAPQEWPATTAAQPAPAPQNWPGQPPAQQPQQILLGYQQDGVTPVYGPAQPAPQGEMRPW